MSSEVDLEGFQLGPAKEPSPETHEKPRKPGKVYTFYSFKGGVGRSMAMANIAVLLAAQGKKVLMLDFDLEAPGLEHFFMTQDKSLAPRLASTPGVIDLLKADTADWRSAVQAVQLDLQDLAFSADGTGQTPQLDIIHSGRASRPPRDYTDQVQQLNWPELYSKHDIGTRFGQFRAEWIAQYDYVLIDSRTGVTDIGDLCTVVLPDHLVLLFVTNEQNISGIKQMYQRAVAEHRNQPFERSKLTVLPVLSRDEFYSENKLSGDWRKRAATELADLFADWLPEGLRPIDAFQKIFIPYFAIWSFGEALPVVSDPEGAANPSSINAAYARIARLILHDLDWASLDVLADPAEIAGTRLDYRREVESERLAVEEKARLEYEKKAEALKAEHDATFKQLSKRRSVGNWLGVFSFIALSVAGGAAYYAVTEGAALTAQNATLEAQRVASMRGAMEAEALAAKLEQDLQQARVEIQSLNEQLLEQTRAVSELRSMYSEARAQALIVAARIPNIPILGSLSGPSLKRSIEDALPPLK